MTKIIFLSLTILSLNLWADSIIKYEPGQPGDDAVPTNSFTQGRNTNAATTTEGNLDKEFSSNSGAATAVPYANDPKYSAEAGICTTCQHGPVIRPDSPQEIPVGGDTTSNANKNSKQTQ